MRGLRLGLGLTNVAATGGAADTTAPTLSSPTGTQTGSTTATIGATTNEGNGTMYGVVTTSSTAPTATQVKAGQNDGGTSAVFAGSVAVSSTGAKTISATGLTNATSYYAHIMHEDAAGNKSSVVSSAQFTTGFPEMLSNGGFDDTSAWTVVNGSITGGKWQSSGSAGQMIYQPVTYVSGATYRFTADYTFIVGAKIRVNQSSTNGASIPTGGVSGSLTSPGTVTIDFTASVSGAGFLSIEADSSGYNGTLDNCSLKRTS